MNLPRSTAKNVRLARMANAAAFINEGLWRKDREFQKLPRTAQCTYCQVLSQKDLDTAGGLTLNLDVMAKACDELTVEQLKADLTVLEERRFVFVDYDTDELLVRSYVRLVSWNSPKNNAGKSVPKNARMIASPKLRHELALELRRLRRRECDDLAEEIDPTPSGPPSDSLPTPSENEGASDPLSTSTVLVPVSPSVVGSVGEEPSPFCPKHPNDTEDSCFACGQARRSYPERLAKWKEDQAAARRAAIKACKLCDEMGMREVPPNAIARCNHQEAS